MKQRYNKQSHDRFPKIDMDYEELVNRVMRGEEFNFYYDEIEYWISNDGEKNYLTDATSSVTHEFESAEELFKNGKICGKSIVDVWDEAKI